MIHDLTNANISAKQSAVEKSRRWSWIVLSRVVIWLKARSLFPTTTTTTTTTTRVPSNTYCTRYPAFPTDFCLLVVLKPSLPDESLDLDRPDAVQSDIRRDIHVSLIFIVDVKSAKYTRTPRLRNSSRLRSP
jgi:hypothetical protein